MPASIISIVFFYFLYQKNFEAPNWLVSNCWQKMGIANHLRVFLHLMSHSKTNFTRHGRLVKERDGRTERISSEVEKMRERQNDSNAWVSQVAPGFWTRWSKDTWNSRVNKAVGRKWKVLYNKEYTVHLELYLYSVGLFLTAQRFWDPHV